MTTDEALRVVQQLGECGVREVALIGGEAYLRDDWEIVARAITEAGIYCSMVTGGRGLDAALASRIRKSGIVSVAVSIDGLEAAHDQQRGIAGSFRSALNALDHLHRAGIKVSVNTQLNRLSLPDLELLLEVLKARHIWAWGVQITVAMGRAADNPDWLLQPYELLDLFPRLASMQQRCVNSGIRFAPGNNIGYFGPFEQVLRGGVSGTGYWNGCQAGEKTLGIEADGTLKGCPSLPTTPYAGGNLKHQSLRELLREPPLRVIQERSTSDLWGYCQECYYADICKAGCTWTSHVLFGKPGNNPYCHYRALQFQKEGLQERLIRTSPAPGIPFDHGIYRIVVEPAGTRESSHASSER